MRLIIEVSEMEEAYWEVNDDEYEVIDMEAEEKLCNELITKGQAFQVIANNNSSTKMTLACYDALLDGIAKAKVIDAEPKWIPTSERLPEENTWYIATIIAGGKTGVACRLYVNGFRNWENVVAWMPLPEPYKGEQDE